MIATLFGMVDSNVTLFWRVACSSGYFSARDCAGRLLNGIIEYGNRQHGCGSVAGQQLLGQPAQTQYFVTGKVVSCRCIVLCSN